MNLIEKLRQIKFKKIKVFDCDVNVRLLTIKEIEDLKLSSDTDKNIELISNLFYNPENNEKFFSFEFLKNEIANSVLIELYKKAIEANGSVESEVLEKN